MGLVIKVDFNEWMNERSTFFFLSETKENVLVAEWQLSYCRWKQAFIIIF